MKWHTVVLAGGGATLVAAWLLLTRKAKAQAKVTQQAVATGGEFKVHATGYWPFQSGLSAAGRKMEGGVHDRKGQALHTVEDFFAGKADHVSVSGDDAIFPYGQKILVNWFSDTIVGRVTDTGGHFRGAGKVYRVLGEEPLDFCVASSRTPVPKKGVVAKIVAGDHMDKGSKAIAASRFQGQRVVGLLGIDVFVAGGT